MSLVELDRYSDAARAHIIRGRLEAAGIPAFCFDSGMNAIYSQPLLFQVRVMVPAEQLAEAWAVLGEGPPLTVEEHAAEGYHTNRRRWWLALGLVFGIFLFAFLVWLGNRASYGSLLN